MSSHVEDFHDTVEICAVESRSACQEEGGGERGGGKEEEGEEEEKLVSAYGEVWWMKDQFRGNNFPFRKQPAISCVC